MEGILMPRNNGYWFESLSDVNAEIVHVLYFDRDQRFQRDDEVVPKFAKEDVHPIYGGIRPNK